MKSLVGVYIFWERFPLLFLFIFSVRAVSITLVESLFCILTRQVLSIQNKRILSFESRDKNIFGLLKIWIIYREIFWAKYGKISEEIHWFLRSFSLSLQFFHFRLGDVSFKIFSCWVSSEMIPICLCKEENNFSALFFAILVFHNRITWYAQRIVEKLRMTKFLIIFW